MAAFSSPIRAGVSKDAFLRALCGWNCPPMTIREQIRRHEEEGLSPLRARLAVLDVLARRAPAELEYVVREYRGRYRELRSDESSQFWDGAWRVFRRELEAGDEAAAVRLLEQLLDRVEPRP